jgi:hypothetical protein
LAKPKVWYRNTLRLNLNSSPAYQRSLSILSEGDRQKEEAAAQAAITHRQDVQKAQLQINEQNARHSISPYSGDPESMSWLQRAQTPHYSPVDYLQSMNPDYDDELHTKLGLPDTITIGAIRDNPSALDRYPIAKERLARVHSERMAGTNKEENEKRNLGQKIGGWISDNFGKTASIESAAALGEAFELLWKPLDMTNEQLEKWFPEDATGTRRLMGNALLLKKHRDKYTTCWLI